MAKRPIPSYITRINITLPAPGGYNMGVEAVTPAGTTVREKPDSVEDLIDVVVRLVKQGIVQIAEAERVHAENELDVVTARRARTADLLEQAELI